jgi:hypothetical protein
VLTHSVPRLPARGTPHTRLIRMWQHCPMQTAAGPAGDCVTWVPVPGVPRQVQATTASQPIAFLPQGSAAHPCSCVT